MVPYLRENLENSCLKSMLGSVNLTHLIEINFTLVQSKTYPNFPLLNHRPAVLSDATIATCVFDDHTSYPVDPLQHQFFLDNFTKTFAFIFSKVGIHVQCDQSRSLLLMAGSIFHLFSNWRISNRSQNHLISDYLIHYLFIYLYIIYTSGEPT